MKRKPLKRWLPVGILAGLLVLILAVVLRPSAPVNEAYDRARLVEVTALQQAELAPQITGFGRVQPKVIWQAVAELGGPVRTRHPELETGRLLKQGTVLLEVDPLEYELRLAQAEADGNAARAQLTRVDQNASNLRDSLELEQGRLSLAQAETERQASLKAQGLVSSSELDSQRQSLLAQRKLVQELENQLRLLPDDRKVAQAQLKVAQAAVADARRRLSQTRILMPFDGRIAAVNVETDQVISANQVLVEVHGIDQMEVEAAVSLHDMRSLLTGSGSVGGDIDVAALGLSASVQLDTGRFQANWPARVIRVRESVDPTQATVGVVLAIEQDYGELDLATRPPLIAGLFVSAQIRAPQQSAYVVPARALRGDKLYVMTAAQQLRIVPVEVRFRQGDQVAIHGEFVEGEQVILNDLLPAVAGMSLRTAQSQSDEVLAP
ncbi:efflux RND transporter periplasmic adaptor subunit [Ferrimonas pelagia]|uniref:Acriflavin resistance protein n=1 Tax=Ferrimonas pelagia TaxID=1177826 RepID=A0ABP9EIB8_9GAMM